MTSTAGAKNRIIEVSKNGLFQLTQKLFLRDKDHLLVLRDKKSGTGDLPGGRMTEGEFFGDWRISLMREIEEELGTSLTLEIDPEPVFTKKHRVEEGNFPCIILAYRANFLTGEIRLSDEHDYFEWVDLKTYNPKILFSAYMLDAVEFYIQHFK